MESFSKLATWVLPKKETKVLLLGLSYSGKTTLMYHWKEGYAIPAYPTLDYNIETIQHKRWQFNMWDVAGWDKIQRHTPYYMTAGSVIFFVHDCTADEQTTKDSIKLMDDHVQAMINKSVHHIWVLLNKQDMLPPDQQFETVRQLRWRFTEALEKYTNPLGWYPEAPFEWRIMDQRGLSAKTGEQLRTVLDDVVRTLDSKPKRTTPPPFPNSVQAESAERVLDSIENAVKGVTMPSETELRREIKLYDDQFRTDDDCFWDLFLKAKLQRWDHRACLRAAYKVLLDALKRGGNLWEAADEFLNHLYRLRSTETESRFLCSCTDNRTMTMFWMYHINLAINGHMAEKRLRSLPNFADFEGVLLQCPELIHAWLWSFYYSEELIFSAESKQYWRLPDLKPLPPPVVTSPPRAIEASPSQCAEDAERLIRFAFSVVKVYLNKPDQCPNLPPRGSIISKALPALQSTIQRRRANPNHRHIAPYSETQAYFWIQLIHSAFASIDAIYFDRSDATPIETKQLSYTGFQMLFHIEPTAWKKHYTEKLWNSIAARVSFVSPDLAPLPNAIRPESAGLTHLYLAKEWETRLVNTSPELPSDEELAFYTELVLTSVGLIRAHTLLLRSLYDAFVEAERTTTNDHEDLAKHYHQLVDSLVDDGLGFKTHARFWALMVLKAASAAEEEKASTSDGSFEDLIRSNRHLSYEELPFCYYSEELWNSEKAREEFVMPDRRKLDMGKHVDVGGVHGKRELDTEGGDAKKELEDEMDEGNELADKGGEKKELEDEIHEKEELEDEADDKKEWIIV